jgi:hypothetical protein
MRRVFASRGAVALDANEARLVGLWLTKTLLLQAHPRARYADPVVEKHALRWRDADCPPRRFVDWLVDGSEPPEGLSLWVHRTDEGDEERSPARYRIPLPELTCDGERTTFVTFQVSWHGLDTTLVVHPRWAIDHPLERDGTAVRLVPAIGAVDLGELPVVRRRTVAWMRCRVTLRDGALDSPELPPLSPSMYPFTALPELLPFVTLWAG